MCCDTPRIQPPLIRSRYYVRNAKRVVASLRVSHVVLGANERRLYSQAGAITSEKQILMVLNESFSVAKYFTFFLRERRAEECVLHEQLQTLLLNNGHN